METLLTRSPDCWLVYLALAAASPLAVRAVTSHELASRTQVPWPTAFRTSSWLPLVLGIFEMLAYPMLIVSSQVGAIGGWLLFKTVHRAQYAPTEKRGPYNRYLVANAMILCSSYLSARWSFL